ncbi:MAG: VWA domain-containing protein [Candidatus Thermofonsia Clade 1 bacterium]|jgi:Ca-activated chloride channel family protein|uniref:VWA domain-containing protein n=1 Tax=Candidatus Thermofonsia Clade 1 bacterium TaxID=2364210 RepID=A0A2M8PCS1_9CHLR|nr:MAG: VWA domain-containing protein [Candidatus Thermofonsia Clade 1 bacterium]
MNKISLGVRRLALLLTLIVVIISGCSGETGPGSASQPTQPPRDTVRVLFTYGSEKDTWVKAVTRTFNSSGQRLNSGKLVVVEPMPFGSVESGMDIVEGRTQPALWSPASRLTLPVVNEASLSARGQPLVDEGECLDLVISPTVIMMWRPMAEALGYPEQPIGWADLLNLAISPNGWADYGKPQWGRLRFGHTHPDYSNSGLQSIVAIAYAAAGKQRSLTPEDIAKPEVAQFMRQIENTVAHYGRSTGFFGNAMAQRGTAYLSAAVVYENVVIEINSDPRRRANLEFPLVAIYPKEGTLLTDHPACIPDMPYMTPELREAAQLYRKFLLQEAQQRRALEFGFRPSDPSIPLTAPFTPENGVDPRQPQTTLAVPSAATIRAIRDIWEQQKRPVNLTMVFDVSGSMRERNRMENARNGAVAFINQLKDEDRLTLIAFNDKQTIVFDDLQVGPNRERIKRDILSLLPGGGTALFDSIAFAIERQQEKLSRDTINALVVMTDGEDTNSERFRDATTLMDRFGASAENAVDISIFTIGYDLDESGLRPLRIIADRGRGAFYEGKVENIRDIYTEISTFF